MRGGGVALADFVGAVLIGVAAEDTAGNLWLEWVLDGGDTALEIFGVGGE